MSIEGRIDMSQVKAVHRDGTFTRKDGETSAKRLLDTGHRKYAGTAYHPVEDAFALPVENATPDWISGTLPDNAKVVEEIEAILTREDTPDEGRKDDGAKVRYDLLPPEFLEGAAEILTFGAQKYGERNWEKGMAWGRPFGALMRHMWAWWRGEPADPETGKSHLWHAACCIAFLMAFEARGTGRDDRPKA